MEKKKKNYKFEKISRKPVGRDTEGGRVVALPLNRARPRSADRVQGCDGDRNRVTRTRRRAAEPPAVTVGNHNVQYYRHNESHASARDRYDNDRIFSSE